MHRAEEKTEEERRTGVEGKIGVEGKTEVEGKIGVERREKDWEWGTRNWFENRECQAWGCLVEIGLKMCRYPCGR